MHPAFFPLSSEAEITDRLCRIAQEFHIYDENMPVHRFLYFSDKVPLVWNAKKDAIEKQEVYIGG